jgi:hypothetical protein
MVAFAALILDRPGIQAMAVVRMCGATLAFTLAVTVMCLRVGAIRRASLFAQACYWAYGTLARRCFDVAGRNQRLRVQGRAPAV